MNDLGYLKRFTFVGPEAVISQSETDLLFEMWLVLLEANNSKNNVTLASLKRFLFIVGGLETTEQCPKLRQLFLKFKPFMHNRIANQGKQEKKSSP
jgi:hypothetical protein